MIDSDLTGDLDETLPASVCLAPSDEIRLEKTFAENDTIWLAPEGTAVFNESASMTSAKGNSGTITVPKENGEYRLYIEYADGTISAASENIVLVGSKAANVNNGEVKYVSKINPFVLKLNDKYTYTLNGAEITDGYEISAAGDWTLSAAEKSSGGIITINFKTKVSDPDMLLPFNLNVKPGNTIHLSYCPNAAGKTVWIAPYATEGGFEESDTMIEMLVQSHDGTIALLPAIPSAWENGELKGIATREGADLDLKWADGVPTEAKFYANQSGPINVRSKYVSEVYVYDENGFQVETSLNDDRNLVTFEAEAGKTYTMSNFGSGVLEGDLIYPASNVTEFYASDGGNAPKASSSGIGYMYNRENVKVGYAIDYFDFNGLQTATLKMASVRQDNTYLTITLDTPTGTEIAKQLIKKGDNVIEFKNLDGVTGKHKIWLLYSVEPYNSSQTYIGDASDLTASYKKSPIKPNPYIYAITSAVADGGKISADIIYNGEGEAPGAVLIAAAYDTSGALSDYGEAAVNGTQNVTVDCAVPEDGSVKVYIWDSLDNMQPLSAAAQVKN